MKCRDCLVEPAQVAIRAGLEWHPVCQECSYFWGLDARHGDLSKVEPHYRYEGEERV